ncbi:farnesylcysteine lyase-like [Populus alba x Populus x berolinensis]|nr:farnesylcysteine lyase-like [Populus alba x Populus x berolinensis]
MVMSPLKIIFLLAIFRRASQSHTPPPPPPPQPEGDDATVCIIGSGIGGSSVAPLPPPILPPATIPKILIFERPRHRRRPDGHRDNRRRSPSRPELQFSTPKTTTPRNYTNLLNLKGKRPSSSESSISLGIWDGNGFVVKTLNVEFKLGDCEQDCVFFQWDLFVYEIRVFTCKNGREKSLKEELVDGVKLAPLLIKELVTVITRINYGQSVNISGLAGAVSLAGSGGGLWAVEGGNWQMAAGLINSSDVELHLHEEIDSISYLGEYYELNSTKGNSYSCEVAVVATPLDESSIQFSPPVSVPMRQLQHTHATFVRGLVNHVYFGLKAVSEIPELVATIEDPGLPFTSISILRCYNETDMTYKIFSRQAMTDALLE